MMDVWTLPTYLNVGGEDWEIETDFRKILKILCMFNNPEYDPDDKWSICLGALFKGFNIDNPPPNKIIAEMQEKAMEFIDMGIKDDGKRKPHTMDWEQDAAVIIPSVNRVLGKEVRALEYLHWWTFLGAYMEIGESLFSQILNIRQKKAKGKKLEKYEQEFYKDNKALIDLQVKRVERSQEEKDELRKLFGFK